MLFAFLVSSLAIWLRDMMRHHGWLHEGQDSKCQPVVWQGKRAWDSWQPVRYDACHAWRSKFLHCSRSLGHALCKINIPFGPINLQRNIKSKKRKSELVHKTRLHVIPRIVKLCQIGKISEIVTIAFRWLVQEDRFEHKTEIDRTRQNKSYR
jgi:hypothetical protein